jgi:hypothetical protein
MKKFLLPLLLVSCIIAQGQTYNNEWINYSRTYYKFKVGATGLYRISQSVLATAGLSSIPAEQFQLWRNGQQVPLYTTIQTGVFSSSDYIEFWGEMNDGKPDIGLYRIQDHQLNDKWSLETDTAAFFLTVNPAGNNLRLVPAANSLPSALTPEPFFIHTVGKYYKDKYHFGYAAVVGEYVYSSSYENGEGFTSPNIGAGATRTETFSNLFPFTGTGAPSPVLKVNATGDALNPRQFEVRVNTNLVATQVMDYFDYVKSSFPLNISDISSGTAAVAIKNACPTADRMVIARTELAYPRQFNFGGANNFMFELPANATGNYLEISGFNFGSTAPVLYDITNGKRYIADISNAPVVRIALEPSTTIRKLLLVTQENSYPLAVSSLQQRNFTNYATAANQGNYLIITHPALLNGSNGSTPVEDYRAYRSSAIGGNHNAKIYMIDQLEDQFGFGIKQHPLSVRNFIYWARNTFSSPVKNVFIIGKGLIYIHNRIFENQPDLAKLSFVPTFGYPASDILLAAEPGLNEIPKVPIGRLSVINGNEITLYLNKVKQYEQQLAFSSPLISDKAWMKNVVHVIGANEGPLGQSLLASMNRFRDVIKDTFYGANVNTFSKLTNVPVEQANVVKLYNLFSEGLGILTYFGHSSASTLEFNLDNPDAYNNQGKYPLIVLLGCNAGNFFFYNLARLSTKETISEKFVLADQRGSIATFASTHLGIVHYLDIYNSRTMAAAATTKYGQTLGEIMTESITQVFNLTTQNDYYARFHCEQTTLHGDPAVRLSPTFTKPDYVIEDQLVNPSFISVAETDFKLDAKFMNIGKAINKNIVIELKRTYPNQTTEVIRRDTIPGIRYIDSIKYTIPIVATRDKGLNKFTITVEADQVVDELYETNNSITKDVFIFEDEIRPVYPYNYAIVGRQGIKFQASTANPFVGLKQYKMEIDTTKLFNSPQKREQTITSVGGVVEFNPAFSFSDSTVYYWRVAPVVTSGTTNWNYASFIYLANHEDGFNQSHYFQHKESSTGEIELLPNRKWVFDSLFQNIFARNTIYPQGGTQDAEFTVAVNGSPFIGGGCNFNAIILNVFDPNSLAAWRNSFTGPGGSGLYESLPQPCGSRREYNFEYSYFDTSGRRKMMNFLNNVVPDGYYVVARGNIPASTPIPAAYPDVWRNDTLYYGSGNSLYHTLKNQGFATLDSFNRPRTWIFIYQKNRQGSFQSLYTMGESIYDKLTLLANIKTSDTTGYVESPIFGRAKQWKMLKFNGNTFPDPPGSDSVAINLIGINNAGQETILLTGINPALQSYDISSVNASVYPYIKLRMYARDKVNFTPYQLAYWRTTYVPVPEGAIAPNILFQHKDTMDIGEPFDFKVAFKNVSHVPFDSLKLKMMITDRNNVTNIIPLARKRPLTVFGTPSDTIQVGKFIDTKTFAGKNTLFIEVNPDDDQPEQYHFNNFAFRDFYVKPDSISPLLDVTFDGAHILNRDIVSSKPEILIKLKDEAKWMILDDTSALTVRVRFPNGNIRRYHFNNDTLRFNPAGSAPNTDNTASVNFNPYFMEDGEYELIVTGKDRSENNAGNIEYRVIFEVINKPMISNMLNYPNPFTTSTAFVFTITGYEVPQNIKIEIMTVTGKIVREITKDELGPLRIGRNITEFKWDGTDQYGQKLANGVYLYRVVTNLNGKALDKYKADGDNTDKYFNKGYGKMYLMR